MAKIPPDERTVYLAFKNVFKGPEAQPQTDKSIRRKIRKHGDQGDEVRALIQEHSVKSIGGVVKALLSNDIFASTLNAKIRFPELFDVSPAQSAERAATEAAAAKTEIDAMRDASVTQHEKSASLIVGEEAIAQEVKLQMSGVSSRIGSTCCPILTDKIYPKFCVVEHV